MPDDPREKTEVGSPEYERCMDALMAERLNMEFAGDPFEGMPVWPAGQSGPSLYRGGDPPGDDVEEPRLFWVTPSMNVDLDHGEGLTAEVARARIEAGGRITVRSEQVARDVVAAFGLSPAEIDQALLFGKTGRLF